MFDDESLRSKYTRLGVEFKKLREKHRITKDSLKEAADKVTALETKILDQGIHTRNLEHEKESLIFRNQYLVKQATFLQNQLEAATQRQGRLKLNDHQPSTVPPKDDALNKALQECSNLHEEVYIYNFSIFTYATLRII